MGPPHTPQRDAVFGVAGENNVPFNGPFRKYKGRNRYTQTSVFYIYIYASAESA